MDVIIMKIFENPRLSENLKKALFLLFQDYQDKNYGYLSIGEAYNLLNDLLLLDKDLKNFNCESKTYMAFVYHYAKRYCVNSYGDTEEDKIILWDKMYRNLIMNTIIFDDKRKYFLELENPQTDLVENLKKVAILFEELLILIVQNKNYLVVKKYHEIIELCNHHGLDSSLLEKGNEEKLKTALERKYSELSFYRNPSEYRKQVKRRKVSAEEDFAPDNFVYFETPNTVSYMIQKLIHSSLMREFYFRTGYFVKPLTRDINLYYLADLVIVAYRFDDVPDMTLKKSGLELNWKDRDFWSTIFNPEINFVDGGNIGYFIEEPGEIYSVKPQAFQGKDYEQLGNKVIFAPEKYLDEVVSKYASYYENLDESKKSKSLDISLEKYIKDGLDTENITDKLMTSDEVFYFKDPTLVDDLEVENIEDHYYLNLIKSKTGSARNRSIASIRAISEKNPKSVPQKTENKPNNIKKTYKKVYKSPEDLWYNKY